MKRRINNTFNKKILVTGNTNDISTIKDNELMIVGDNNIDIYSKSNGKVVKKSINKDNTVSKIRKPTPTFPRISKVGSEKVLPIIVKYKHYAIDERTAHVDIGDCNTAILFRIPYNVDTLIVTKGNRTLTIESDKINSIPAYNDWKHYDRVVLFSAYKFNVLNIQDYKYFYIVNTKEYYTKVKYDHYIVWCKGIVKEEVRLYKYRFSVFGSIRKPEKRHSVIVSVKKYIEANNLLNTAPTEDNYLELFLDVIMRLAVNYYNTKDNVFLKIKNETINEETLNSTTFYKEFKRIVYGLCDTKTTKFYIRFLYTTKEYCRLYTESGVHFLTDFNLVRCKVV